MTWEIKSESDTDRVWVNTETGEHRYEFPDGEGRLVPVERAPSYHYPWWSPAVFGAVGAIGYAVAQRVFG